MRFEEALRILESEANTFAAIIANPPYQVEVAQNTDAEQKTVMNVFHRHQEIATALALRTAFIYPGERWINRSGKGMRDFGSTQINSPNLVRLVYWPDSTEVFNDVRLGDGLSITFLDRCQNSPRFILDFRSRRNKLYEELTLAAPGQAPLVMDPRLQTIVNKTLAIADKRGLKRLDSRTTPQKTFAIESNFVQLNPHMVRSIEDEPKDTATYCKIFTNDSAGKAGRARWFWLARTAVKANAAYIDKYKIIVSSMNPVGARGTGHSPLAQILRPGEIFGRSRIGVAVFDTELEALNFFKFFQTDFARFHYACLGDSQTLLGLNVPDLEVWDTDEWEELSVDELNTKLCDDFKLTAKDRSFMADWVGKLAPLVKSPVPASSAG